MMLSVCCLFVVCLTVHEHRSCQTSAYGLLHAWFQTLAPAIRGGRRPQAEPTRRPKYMDFMRGAPSGPDLVLYFHLVKDSRPCLFFACTDQSQATRLSSNRRRSKQGKLVSGASADFHQPPNGTIMPAQELAFAALLRVADSAFGSTVK
jgi:hypothetical protein